MIAPIVVTVILVLYYVAYFGILIALLEGIWKVVLGNCFCHRWYALHTQSICDVRPCGNLRFPDQL